MLGEGVEPASIEHAGAKPVTRRRPLQLSDELNLELMARSPPPPARVSRTRAPPTSRIRLRRRRQDDRARQAQPLERRRVLLYVDGKRTGLWPGLREAFKSGSSEPPLQDMIDRMLFAEALETQKCLDEGVLTSTATPTSARSWVWVPAVHRRQRGSSSSATRAAGGTGKEAFVARAKELAARYGDRFNPPASRPSSPPGKTRARDTEMCLGVFRIRHASRRSLDVSGRHWQSSFKTTSRRTRQGGRVPENDGREIPCAKHWDAYGVTAVFLVPTVLSRTLVEMERTAIRRIVTHGEKAAVYMADGYARATGRPGICMSQNVGAANLARGDCVIRSGLLAGDRVDRWTVPVEPWAQLLPGGRGLPAVQAGDPIQSPGPPHRPTARSARSGVPGRHRGKPGPHTSNWRATTGDDIENGTLDASAPEPSERKLPGVRIAPDLNAIRAAADALRSAQRPVIVSGGGVRVSGANAEIVADRCGNECGKRRTCGCPPSPWTPIPPCTRCMAGRMGARKGYNRRTRGRKAYQPILNLYCGNARVHRGRVAQRRSAERAANCAPSGRVFSLPCRFR